MSRLFCTVIALVTTYKSERIVVVVDSFQSIRMIPVVHNNRFQLSKHYLLQQPHCNDCFSQRRRKGSFQDLRRLHAGYSDIRRTDHSIDTTVTSTFTPSDSDKAVDPVDDNVATLRSVTFSNLPKDQGNSSFEYDFGICSTCGGLMLCLFLSSSY